ncbi:MULTISPECIES: hypothetical protein [unclassified Paenibacillus]|uniref:hypothetical protein n=1 Tax=unclassified Paenibacillus TaxID=185978 RepID=UPI003836E1EF
MKIVTNRKWVKGLISLVVLSMFVTLGLSSGSVATAAESQEPEMEKYQSVSQDSIQKILNDIENVPDEVLNSNDATTINNYFKSIGSQVRVTDSNNYEELATNSNVIKPAGAWECGLAIAGLVVTTAVPIAKIVKIGKLVKSLGGAVEAAKLIWGASFASEKWKALGGAAKDLVAELAGITAVSKACF